MNLRLLREAELELHTAGLWYEEQSEGLGSRFQLDLARAFETIEANPDRFAKVPHLPAGIPTESVVQFGPTVSTILAVAAASQADLIAMCSHG